MKVKISIPKNSTAKVEFHDNTIVVLIEKKETFRDKIKKIAKKLS